MKQTKLFRLSMGDLGRGLVVAILSAILLTVQNWITNPSFSVFNLGLGDVIILVNIAIVAGLGYLAKNLVTDEEGKLLGKY
jgi:hypothetical protein